MKRISWLHMSDIHYNFDNYDTMMMRDATISYLKTLQMSFDFMIITGGIRYKDEPYSDDTVNFIHQILGEMQINKDNLFIVPGNHDVKRSFKRKTLIKGITSSENSSDEVNILDNETYTDLLSGQNEFFEIYKKLTGKDYKDQELHFVENRADYNIIHINTCLISGIDKEDEQKKLIIGQKNFVTL